MRKRALLLAAVTAMALLAVACGGGEEPSGGGAKAVSVELKEYSVTPDASSVASGKATFAVKNSGTMAHEFVIIKTDLAADKLPVKGALVDETAAGITVVGEIEEFAAGTTESSTFDLSVGKYVLICNVAGHYTLGMRTLFEVM